jgi:hypothetical protein
MLIRETRDKMEIQMRNGLLSVFSDYSYPISQYKKKRKENRWFDKVIKSQFFFIEIYGEMKLIYSIPL